MRNFFKAPPPAAQPITDPQEIRRTYAHWRWRQMYASFFGYVLFYFLRKNWSVALPGIARDLGYDNKTLGTVNTVHYFLYSVGKFFNGVLADRSNIRAFMATGLLLSAVCNFFFGLSTGFYALAIWWGFNGWFQSMGWPPCAKLLTHWYSYRERGSWWGLWSLSHNVGAFVILFSGGWLTQTYGWHSAFFFPAVAGLFGFVFLLERLRDRPEELGLPPIEDFKNDHPAVEKDSEDESYGSILLHRVLVNPYIWLMALLNLCVYTCRYGIIDWAPKFLVESKGSSIATAGYKTALLEVAGMLGTISAGWLSDRFFPRRRVAINIFYLAFLSVAIYAFWFVPGDALWVQLAVLSFIGFMVYGPQMLVGGPCTADFTSKKAAATATGFVGMAGYFGAMLTGTGFGAVVDRFGWKGGFISLSVVAVIGCLICLVTLLSGKGRSL